MIPDQPVLLNEAGADKSSAGSCRGCCAARSRPSSPRTHTPQARPQFGNQHDLKDALNAHPMAHLPGEVQAATQPLVSGYYVGKHLLQDVHSLGMSARPV
jgi:hypothetical protein